ncbi:baseplate assembly protein [Salmonella enterica]|nr:baseplate assembly protein [Salmonella enterica subsp. diarizonae]ELB6470212.1 baseplate assembly protein [Salmonella enterica]
MPTVDLSQLPFPEVIETLDFDTLLNRWVEKYISFWPQEQQDAVRAAVSLESDPVRKILETAAYQDMLLRQRINEGAAACMVAYSQSGDLDNLGANYNITRLTVTPEKTDVFPPVPARMESDSDLRLRIPQAFEGISTAGPVNSYIFHARSADGRVADASAVSPKPACVTVSVLSREGNGTASEDLLNRVRFALNDEDVRPVADRLTVQSATIVEYEIDAVLYLYPGPEAGPILAASTQKLEQYISDQHRLGRDIRLSAIYAACHVEGVQRVVLNKPAADQVLNDTQASWCTRHTLAVGGTDE